MILTHLVFFRFFTGAAESTAPPVVVTPPVHTGAFGPIPGKRGKPRKVRRDDATGLDYLEPLEPAAKKAKAPTDRVMTAAELGEMRELLLAASTARRRVEEDEMMLLLMAST